MKKLTDKELRQEFESTKGQLRLALVGLILGGLGVVLFVSLWFDPFKWLEGPPAVHEAKKWIALCICFILIPGVLGVWFLVVQPLRWGVVTVGGWANVFTPPSPARLVLRSEQPVRFRIAIAVKCVMLAAVFALGIGALRSFMHDLEKARAEPPKSAPANAAGASRLQSLRPVRRVAELGSLVSVYELLQD